MSYFTLYKESFNYFIMISRPSTLRENATPSAPDDFRLILTPLSFFNQSEFFEAYPNVAPNWNTG